MESETKEKKVSAADIITLVMLSLIIVIQGCSNCIRLGRIEDQVGKKECNQQMYALYYRGVILNVEHDDKILKDIAEERKFDSYSISAICVSK